MEVLYNHNKRLLRQLRAIRINSAGADFLVERIAEDFALRICAINREFTNAVDLYSFSGKLSNALVGLENISSIRRFEQPDVAKVLYGKSNEVIEPWPMDSNKPLPEGLDLVVSAMGLHTSNNLPEQLSRIISAMKKDGLLMMALPVSGTLKELRECLVEAELELTGGAALRVNPFIDLQQAGSLIQSAGFKLPVVDREDFIVRYDNLFSLIRDLRAMGVTSVLEYESSYRTHRQLFHRADELYRQKYCDEDGRIRASFCLAYMTGWAPHEDQQKPLKPGSAKFSLARGLGQK
ncbi:MAG: SAM-dependent methyltransferase [Rhizobiaceae bacterium]|nr:SAM-dependent methyltransferase [Rhizobiaceae bacterium]